MTSPVPPVPQISMPAIFVGHGNPMNAISQNAFTKAWSKIGIALPVKPKAVLCVSAHWYVPKTAVTAMSQPRTIHDFGGFPPELYKVEYPAPGSLELAAEVADLLSPDAVMDTSWGLDHGAWSVLMHIFPAADIPVVQLSIDETRGPAWHYEIAARLAPLRDRDVLILGSGNIVHNLHAYAWGKHDQEPYDWALRFEKSVRNALTADDAETLVAYEKLERDALLSVPTPDHYLPFLYVLAQRRRGQNEPIMFPVEGFDDGSISMLAVRIG